MTTDSATDEATRLKAIFDERKAELRCPVCGNETMALLEKSDLTLTDRGSGVGLYFFGKPGHRDHAVGAYPTVTVACNNCGLVRQFLKQFLIPEPGTEHVG
jgi:ribosomal protein S27E